MRWIILGLASVAFCINGQANAQPTEQDIDKLLAKHGIHLGPLTPDKDDLLAHISQFDGEALKAFELLGRIKKLKGISISTTDHTHLQTLLKGMEGLPGVKHLEIDRCPLTADDFEKMAALTQLESLFLESYEVSDKQISALRALKNLKSLHVVCVEVSPKSLDELKLALPRAKIDVTREPMLILFRLSISPNDDALARLQKQKYNAAADGIRAYLQRNRAGIRTVGDSDLMHHLRLFKETALEMNDRELAAKIIDGYVEILEQNHKEAKHDFEAGRIDPFRFHLIRAYYLDAQILQLKLKKQKEK